MRPKQGFVAAAWVLVLACAGEPEREIDYTNDAADTISAVIRSAKRTDTIRLYRFVAPDEHSPQFSTYVPLDFAARTAARDSNAFVSFVRRAPGLRSDQEPFVHVYFYPEGTPERRARGQVESFASSRGVPVSEEEDVVAPFSEEGIPPEDGTIMKDRFEWALVEIPYAYRCAPVTPSCAFGRIALGRAGDRFFHVVIQYPPSLAETFLPRARLVMDHWTWHR